MAAAKVHTVSQVARYLKGLLAQDPMLAELWVEGEVSNLRVSQTGHAYFTLKDRQSQLRCVMFNRSAGKDLLGDGAAVTAHGRMSFYDARGSLDLVADLVVAEGVGPLALEYERLKAALEGEGLFDPSRKRPLPRFPKTVGLVTSPTGAVIHDIERVLSRRYPLVEVLLAPSLVQGPGAAAGLQRAMRALIEDGRSELIILARGGGSLEELWPFNEEPVARAIYASPIPVVSAVGHETDYTIADFVADVRCPTPSVAAEMVAPDKAALRGEVASLCHRLSWRLSGMSAEKRGQLSNLAERLHRGAPDTAGLRRRVDDALQRAAVSATGYAALRRERLRAAGMRLKALDPGATLRRGYAVVQRESTNEVVSRRGQVGAKEPLRVTVSDGNFAVVAGGKPPRKRPKKEPVGPAGRLFP